MTGSLGKPSYVADLQNWRLAYYQALEPDILLSPGRKWGGNCQVSGVFLSMRTELVLILLI